MPGKKVEKEKVEVCRSFAYKLNVPGKYESRDFFASQKVECYEDQAEKKSEQLYEFVKNEVMKSVAEYQFDNEPKKVNEKKAVAQGKKWQKDLENDRQVIEEGLEKNVEDEANELFNEEVDNLKNQ